MSFQKHNISMRNRLLRKNRHLAKILLNREITNDYGQELILDLHECDTSKFNRKDITAYYKKAMKLGNMEAGDLHFWDYEGFWRNIWWWLFHPEYMKKNAPPHVKGTTAVQFILTSSIVIHCLDDLGTIYVNIFSCDDFDSELLGRFTAQSFAGKIVSATEMRRL